MAWSVKKGDLEGVGLGLEGGKNNSDRLGEHGKEFQANRSVLRDLIRDSEPDLPN